MRVTRLLLLFFAVALAAGGCAQQPHVRYAAVPAPAPQGIDDVVYGAPTPAAPGYRVTATYPAPASASAAAAASAYVPTATPAVVRPTPAAMVAPAPAALAPAPALAVYSAPFRQGGYTLDSGDRLRVVVFGQDGLTNSYIVDASGHIDMPLIGTVLARGLTTDQLSARIADQLRQGFIREPHVAVEVEAYRPFFILGEVTQPGQYPYIANMTVETAVAIAGGFGPRGYRKSVIISRNVGGQIYRFEVPITYPLCPGDTVQVQERWF